MTRAERIEEAARAMLDALDYRSFTVYAQSVKEGAAKEVLRAALAAPAAPREPKALDPKAPERGACERCGGTGIDDRSTQRIDPCPACLPAAPPATGTFCSRREHNSFDCPAWCAGIPSPAAAKEGA